MGGDNLIMFAGCVFCNTIRFTFLEFESYHWKH